MKDAGYDARIVSGQISQAAFSSRLERFRARLLETHSDPLEQAKNQPESGRPDAAIAWLGGNREALQNRASSLAAKLVRTSSDLESSHDPIKVFWVEYRETSVGPWQSIYPALEDLLADVPVLEYFADSIPPEYQHRIRVDVLFEQNVSGKTQPEQTLLTWQRPTANLVGEDASITFSLLPDTFLNDQDGASAEEKVDKATMFLPFINGQPAPEGHVLTKAGQLIPADAAFSMMGAIFATDADKLDAATSALSGLGQDEVTSDPVRYIQRIWLRVTLSEPGSADRTISRDLARWAGSQPVLNRNLTREITLTIQTGEIPPQQIAVSSIDAIMELFSLVERSEQNDTPFGSRLLKRFEAERFIADQDQMLVALGWQDRYRSGPTRPGSVSSPGRILNGTIRLRHHHSPTQQLADRQHHNYLEVGLLAAALERTRVPFESSGGTAWDHLLDVEDADWHLVSDSGDALLSRLNPETRSRLTQDLQEGWTLLLANRGGAVEDKAWWRVNRRTGELIGALQNGWVEQCGCSHRRPHPTSASGSG